MTSWVTRHKNDDESASSWDSFHHSAWYETGAAKGDSGASVFDVTKYGATGDEKRDDSLA